MLLVALAGVVGFLIFDGYRVNLIRQKKGVVEIFADGFAGVLVKLFVYLCAGGLAIFASLDVLLQFEPTVGNKQELIGSYLRGFAIGLAGPAGISKYDPDAGLPDGGGSQQNSETLDTLEPKTVPFSKRIRFAMRRQFLV